MSRHKITVAYGDGIGPEIMQATLDILEAAKAPLETHTVEIGEKVYLKGHTAGISPDDWKTICDNKIFLKAPITTPQGGGYKSLNVTIRKTLGLYSNVRPVKTYNPFIKSKHATIDMVIVRENEEDLYAGIEHRQTPEVYQCLKLMSEPGTERIIRYAFEYAKKMGRKKVTCMSKDNIMKLTDGLFHKTFDRIAKEYPEIENDHYIIDIGSARLADTPEIFDVVVTANLYGDIISDIVAQIAGSVGVCGSSNIGQDFAMFEAIHGSAPDIAGKDIANPSGLIQGAINMLHYLGESTTADTIENAWLKTLEDGLHTGDIYEEGASKERLGTKAFAQAVIKNLGQKPSTLTAVETNSEGRIEVKVNPRPEPKKELEGVDVFVCDTKCTPDDLGKRLQEASGDMDLCMITNRGVKVFPDGNPATFCTDHWRCRFYSQKEGERIDYARVIGLLERITNANIEVIKTENLYLFDGERGYSLGQGQ